MNTPALLVLEDGGIFRGKSIGVDGISVGEVVFNTAMTGYQEILTDPSYAKQLVTLTYPHIGNVGVNTEDEESRDVFCSGLIVKNVPHRHSNWRSQESLTEYLQRKQVVAIDNIDTRRLTRLLRLKGAQRGAIVTGENIDRGEVMSAIHDFPGLSGMDLASEVSVKQEYMWNQGGAWDIEQGYAANTPRKFLVVAYDYGIKHNIIRLLAQRGCEVKVVPATTSAEEVLSYQPDGVFLSNGPGDPEPCDYAIKAIKQILGSNIPLFGVCLGHQLLALACGAKTMKMKLGHHGANHPVQDLRTKQVFITSQNHGFAVDESSLPDTLEVTHRSLFDGTVQGVTLKTKNAFSIQGHPEASPGPKDIGGLFDQFICMMENYG